ncbi:unnamed protein product [Heterobilharzia americana]|nr:unnamed protein product [Heterobilharzia americana]
MAYNLVLAKYSSQHFHLIPENEIYQTWAGNTTALKTSLYLFNLTNENDVLDGARPVFQEVGPFIYKKQVYRYDLSTFDGSPPKYLRYKAKTYYFQDYDYSLNDVFSGKVTTLDLFSAALALKEENFLMKSYLVAAEPFVTRTPHEIIWGYSHDNIKSCYRFGFCPSDKISVFSSENGTSEEKVVIKTGVEDINELGHVVEFNDKEILHVWESEYANFINGSEGAFMGQELSVGSRRYIFAPGVCRSVVMEATKEVPHPNYPDLKVLLFEPASEDQLDPRIYPPPEAFCKGQDYEPKCAPKGLIALSPCLAASQHVPIYGSQGHLIDVHPDIRNQVKGMKQPNEMEDRTNILVDPITGITLGAHQVMQLSFYLDNTKKPSMMFRIVNEVNVDLDALRTIYRLVHGSRYWFHVTVYAFGGFCLMTFFIMMGAIIRMNRRSESSV